MASIEIKNPSAFNPLRIFSQARVRHFFVDGPSAPPLPKRHTREELQKLGSEIVMVPSRGTAREADGMLRSVTRDVPTPFYLKAGYESLNGFITEVSEKELREFQAAASAAAMLSSSGISRVQHVRDEWNASPQPLMSIPPGETRVIKEHFEENKRILIESDCEAALQIANQSQTRTLRLRNRDSKTGEQTHVAFLSPQQVGLVIANGKSSAVVELMPS
jgi:hypothetical protein